MAKNLEKSVKNFENHQKYKKNLEKTDKKF